MKRLLPVLISLPLLAGLLAAQEHTPPPRPAPRPPAQGTVPSKGYILQVKGNLVYLDLGLRDNVRVGDTFEIIRDEEIVHPITGENLGGKSTIGVVKVTQVFEKLSVAEVVSMISGATMTRLDRIRMGDEPMEPPPPPPPVHTEAAPSPVPEHTAETHEGELVHNPDGVLHGIDVGLGGGYETQQKIRMMGADLLIPLAKRFSLGGDYGYSRESHVDTTLKRSTSDKESEMGGKLRIYLGRWLRGGEDINPDGDVGGVVLDLGGGTRSLKHAVGQPGIVLIDTTKTPPDTTRGTITTTTKTSETALRFGLILPMARKWTLGAGYDWEKHLGRVHGWIRYYTKAIDTDWAGANPDGKIGSLAITLFGSYDTKSAASKKWMGMGLKIPMSRLLTFGLTYDTNQKRHRVRGGLNVHVEKKLW